MLAGLEYAEKTGDGEEFHGGEQNARLVKGECLRVGFGECPC